MKTIVFHATSFETFWAHYSFYTDDNFMQRMASLGYKIAFSDKTDVSTADYIIFQDVTSVGLHRFQQKRKIRHAARRLLGRGGPERDVYGFCQANNLRDRTVLLVMEGVVHMPDNHKRGLAEFFPKILTWNDDLVDNRHFFKYNWPQPEGWSSGPIRPFAEKKLLVNISGNKYSPHPLELYTVRRAGIRYFEQRFQSEFEAYGVGWNEPATRMQRWCKPLTPHYSSYRGEIGDKAEAFRRFKFALCYENAAVPGWITEKIFDCLRSDCVPIYLGAPNIEKFVPADVFIDRQRFSSDEALADFILKIDEARYQGYRERIRDYLNGPRFRSFLATTFAETIVSTLEWPVRAASGTAPIATAR